MGRGGDPSGIGEKNTKRNKFDLLKNLLSALLSIRLSRNWKASRDRKRCLAWWRRRRFKEGGGFMKFRAMCTTRNSPLFGHWSWGQSFDSDCRTLPSILWNRASTSRAAAAAAAGDIGPPSSVCRSEKETGTDKGKQKVVVGGEANKWGELIAWVSESVHLVWSNAGGRRKSDTCDGFPTYCTYMYYVTRASFLPAFSSLPKF